MANMGFGVNILPKTNNTYSLGNSDHKWNLFVNEINGTAFSSLIPDVSGFYTKPSGGIPASDLAETYLTASTEKWHDYTIDAGNTLSGNSLRVLVVKSSNNKIFYQTANKTPTDGQIAMYGTDGCLNSTTPSSGDSSTKVATTAFVDTYFAPKADPVFTGSISMGRRANSTVGNSSTVLGSDNIGAGTCSLVAGIGNNSTGDYSTTSGFFTINSGSYSIVNGYITKNTGESSLMVAIYSVNKGYYNLLLGRYNQAESYLMTTSKTQCNIINGYYNSAIDSQGTEILGHDNVGDYSFFNIIAGHHNTVLDVFSSVVVGKYNNTHVTDGIVCGTYINETGFFNASEYEEWDSTKAYFTGDKVKRTLTLQIRPRHTGSYVLGSHDAQLEEYQEKTVVLYFTSSADIAANTSWGDGTWSTVDLPYRLLIGNGTDQAASNAFAVLNTGRVCAAGNIYVNCNSDSTGGYKVATESYVTTAIANASLSGGGSSVTLATVATTGDYDDLINKPNLSQYLTSVPSLVGATSSVAGTAGLVPAPTTSDVNKFLRGDGTWATPSSGITGITLVSTSLTPSNGVVTIPAMTACSSSAAGATGAVPAPAAGDEDKFLSGDGTWKAGGLPMVILSYGSSTWQSFIDAYNNNVIVYCRASSNSNPASGSQTRMAFMAYVNNATNPTNVEFQYYRSVNPTSKSMSQLCDQVFIYKLDKTSGWSVTTREACIKSIEFAAGTGLTGTFTTSNGKLTISATS